MMQTIRQCTANRMNEPHDQQWTVAGKCCESGDKLIENALIHPMWKAILLAIFCTGAYSVLHGQQL